MPPHKQRGAALLIFFLLLVMAGLGYLVSGLSPESVDARRTQQTQEVLSQARDALIGYAIQYRERQLATGTQDAMYGYLPMPDVGTSRFHASQTPACNTEGCAMSFINGAFPADNETIIGRFPWKTLGLEPLRDGHGECLWYIVSANHKDLGISSTVRMNWDTLSHLDVVVADGTAALFPALTNAHDRPVAVIFSAGPPLPGQNRATSATDDVSRCGGNYDVANYLDPATATALGGVTNYLAGTNKASGLTNAVTPKAISTQGKVFDTGSAFLPNACQGSNCNLVANDIGMSLTGDQLFGAIRKHAYFRTDINAMLDRMVNCLRDQVIASGTAARIADNACYDASQHPLGYYDHYKEQVFIAKPAASFTVNGDNSCAGALLFASQRIGSKQRITVAQKSDFSNYLEVPNFPLTGTAFSGPDLFDRSPPQAVGQDIVRCIPSSASLNEVTSPALDALGGQIVDYDPNTRILTLGRIFSITDTVRDNNASAFFGCSWTPEKHSMGNGFRSYFSFNIADAGEGFTFAVVDGDRNAENACGAAREHLGYSGDNLIRPPIAYPKIGVEIDTSKQTDPYGTGYGRSDPDYNGGHAGIVYWGDTVDGNDDNVHGLPNPPDASPRPSPTNPAVPPIVTQHGAGVARLDATSVSNLLNQNIHVRVEVSPIAIDSNLRKKTYQVDIWLVRGDTDTDMIAAMKNTTRPLRLLYPTIDSASFIHLTGQPQIYDIQGSSCPCGLGQTCGTDNICYTPVFDKVRLGFTTSQSTAAKDQIITISNFFTTWLP
ncbi:MAG: hypothetical protein K8F53_15195 [Rhodocyclaceae bacterium]|nr:hypothetical protein [Rhodocyclaceae bacterium]